MKKYGMNFEESLKYVQCAREVARPNSNFQKVLKQYEKELNTNKK